MKYKEKISGSVIKFTHYQILLRVTIGISLILTGILTSRVMFAKAEGDFASGTGTKDDPYIIKTVEQLQNVGKYCGETYKDKYFKMEVSNNKLDMKSENFTPICSMEDKTVEEGRYNNAFYGQFDGNNTELINFKIETDKFFGGLFGATSGAEIKNIKIGKNSTVTVNGKIEKGISFTGGIVGKAYKTKIENVSNTGSITGTGSCVGGIVGQISINSTIKKATNSGNVSAGKNNYGNSLAGGIAGYASTNITIENVSNTASVTGEGTDVGGVFGALNNSTATNIFNYNENIISSANNVGLLVGMLYDNTSIQNAYTLKENNKDFLVIGSYDENDVLENIHELTKEQFVSKILFTGFDFENVWEMGSEYPVLRELATTNDNKNAVTIKYNDIVYDIPNYLYKDRTYVELNTFCNETGICSVTNENDTYRVTKTNTVTDGGEYTYKVEHKKGSDVFKAYIIIGGRMVKDDENTQASNVKSCPEDVKEYQCSDGKLFVPVRFLTQALGFKVEWNGSTYEVNISDTFVETFNDVYETVLTEGECSGDINKCTKVEKVDGVYNLEKNKNYYFGVINKSTGVYQEYRKFFSFYETANQNGNKEPFIYYNDEFKIQSNMIRTIGKSGTKDIAQVIIYKITGNESDYKKEDYNIGSYPIVINAKFKF